MTVGSLFAGIGGFDLGFERAGFEIKWQVEIDPFCRAVLAKHWPDVRRYEDVRTVGSELGRVDVICGGFPCQDISNAGKCAGIDGDRSGLWTEFARLISELGPSYVVVENVSALIVRGLERVLGDLAASGFDAEWDCLPASAFGAPHQRDRIWLVAYANSSRCASARVVSQQSWRAEIVSSSESMADTNGSGLSDWRQSRQPSCSPQVFGRVAFAEFKRFSGSQWAFEPNVGRVAHGIPARVDRLRGLGNSIVPQIAQWIAERIKKAEGLT